MNLKLSNCENYIGVSLSKCLFTALALIAMHSTYIGQIVRSLSSILIMRNHNSQTGVASLRSYPYPYGINAEND